ncbi:MAG: hypothetical protein H0T56_11470 [Pseudaminobacter sp.]|nr:hypothetical protein [Pseudaminobacter sp.]
MIRLVVIALFAVLIWGVLLMLFRSAKAKNLDWNGVAFAIGFIALAFYLRHLADMG